MDTNALTTSFVLTFVGNNKILSDTVQDFSANPHRRVDLVALDHSQQHLAVRGDGAGTHDGGAR